MKTFIFLILSILVSVCYIFSQPLQVQEAEEIEYILQEIEVKEGQTLSYVANYYLKNPKAWPELLKYNKLSISDIYAPLPGMKLKVPIRLVKEKFRPAYLIYILNNVKYRKRDTVEWITPAINSELYNNDAITTYAQSRANIRFYSGELLVVDENSFVTIRPELKQEEVTLTKGSVRTGNIKVLTETAEIVPRIDPRLPKTDYRTKFREEDKATLVEVYEGAVDVSAQGKTVFVPKGFGTEVKPLQPPSPPRELPPPPELTLHTPGIKMSPQKELIFNLNTPQVSIDFLEPKQPSRLPPTTEIVKPIEKSPLEEKKQPKVIGTLIKQYQLQVAKDSEFKKVLYDEVNEIKPGIKINLDLAKLNLPDGKYYYKVSYIDELGFMSRASTQSFILDRTPPKLHIDLPDEYKTDKETINITGTTEPGTILKVQDRTVDIDQKGNFITGVYLKQGVNKIDFIAKDTAGNETVVYRQIIRVTEKLIQHKISEIKPQQEKKETKLSPITILLTVVTSMVVIGVLLFFIR